jgi:hypothetical protein
MRKLALVVALVIAALVSSAVVAPDPPAAVAVPAAAADLNDCQYTHNQPQCPTIHVIQSLSLGYRQGVRMNQWFNIVWHNCWMQAKIGNLSSKAFTQSVYAAGPCSDNTGQFMYVQLRTTGSQVRYYDPANDGTTYNRCTYWHYPPGCSMITSDHSLFYGDPSPQATDIVYGYFLICVHDGLDDADICGIHEVSPF